MMGAKDLCRCRIALYAVIAVEGIFLGWVILVIMITVFVLNLASKAGPLKEEIFRDLPIEIVTNENAPDPMAPPITRGVVGGFAIYIVFQVINIACIIFARYRRKHHPLLFSFLWIFLYSGIMIGGVIHGIMEIKRLPPDIPPFPNIAMKQAPLSPYLGYTVTQRPRVTLPPLPKAPEPLNVYYRDSLAGVCDVLIQIAVLKCILALFSLITIAAHLRIYKNRIRTAKPTFV